MKIEITWTAKPNPKTMIYLRWDPNGSGAESTDSVFSLVLASDHDEQVGTLVESAETDDEIKAFADNYSLACATYGELSHGEEYTVAQLVDME